jgi:hypothetical protein
VATNQIERLVETTPAYRDYVRQGLITFSKHFNGDQQNLPIDDSSEYSSVGEELSLFRLCTLNVNYQLCRSYPCLFVAKPPTSVLERMPNVIDKIGYLPILNKIKGDNTFQKQKQIFFLRIY